MITQQKFIDVVSTLTEDDFKQAQDLIEQLGHLFEDETLREHFSQDSLETVRSLINDKYSDEVTIAVLVSKFKRLFGISCGTIEMTEQEIDSLINIVIQDVAELPNRTSPEYWTDAMIVTGDELEEILTNRLKSGVV